MYKYDMWCFQNANARVDGHVNEENDDKAASFGVLYFATKPCVNRNGDPEGVRVPT